MSDDINYKNNPLHGVSLKNLLIEIVDHYGFEILYAYLNINCFKTKPSIESSVKFLKKTDWAREKVEAFYLYQYKNLPKASADQFKLSPRDRIVPEGQVAGEPAELSLEDAERLREKREKKAAEYKKGGGRRSGRDSGGRRDGQSSRSRSNDRNNVWSRGSSDNLHNSSSGSSSPWDRAARDSESSQKSERSGTPDPWGNWKKKTQ